MKYRHILITGGAGFIGSHLTDHLVSLGYTVRILDNLHSQVHPMSKLPEYLNKKAEFIKGDVTNRKDWKKVLSGIDAIVHFAAAVGVGQSMYEIERYVKVNSLGTATLLDILANGKHTVRKILVAASMSSYGEGMYKCPKCQLVQQPALRSIQNLNKKIWNPTCIKCLIELFPIPTSETARLQSPSVYAITKKSQEELVMSYSHAYQVPAVSLRFFNAYGTRQSLSNPYTGVAAIFMSRVKNNHPPIINEDGHQTRDFVHINDIVRACGMVIESENANFGTFNVGSGIPTSIQKISEIIISLSGKKLIPVITNKYRSVDVRHCYADISELYRKVGWKPTVKIADGLKELYEWSKNQTADDKVEKAFKELTNRGLQ